MISLFLIVWLTCLTCCLMGCVLNSFCYLPENYNKAHKPLLQSVYRISSEALGFKRYHIQHHSTASFLFPVHTGSCLCVWSRRRSLWGYVGQKRRNWRAFPASTPAWSLRPGQGRMNSSESSKPGYWRSRRRRCGWRRTSCRERDTHAQNSLFMKTNV